LQVCWLSGWRWLGDLVQYVGLFMQCATCSRSEGVIKGLAKCQRLPACSCAFQLRASICSMKHNTLCLIILLVCPLRSVLLCSAGRRARSCPGGMASWRQLRGGCGHSSKMQRPTGVRVGVHTCMAWVGVLDGRVYGAGSAGQQAGMLLHYQGGCRCR